jgi:hypothetical protein
MDAVLQYVDVVSLVVLGLLSLYGFRTAFVLLRMPETERIRDLWLPILGLPLLIFVLAVGHLVNDYSDVNSLLVDGVSDVITLVAATLLTFSLASFYSNWAKYKKEREQALKSAREREGPGLLVP